MLFQPHPNADKRRQSATTLIKLILDNRTPELLDEQVQELLKILIGKITEADGKYKTAHQSHGALSCTDQSELRHEHVYPRKAMIRKLLDAKRDEVDAILKDAIGCTVTKKEHSDLSDFDKEHYGWERYRKAKVSVRNTQTGEETIPTETA